MRGALSRRIITVILIVLLACLCTGSAAAPAAGRTTATGSTSPKAYEVAKIAEDWTMQDGVRLPVSVYYPSRPRAGEVFPAILLVHGWTLDKTMMEWAARYYAGRGYICVALTARGWFGAGGEVGCMDPEHEMKDVSAIIDLLAKDGRFPLLADGKGPVVGITGASMGGCFSYLKAPRKDPRPGDPGDPRIRAVVPMHGGFDLLFSLYPNGVVKFLWATLLLASSYMGQFTGFMMNIIGLSMDKESDGLQKIFALVDILRKMIPPVTRVTRDLPYIYGVATQRIKSEEEYARHFFKVRSARYWCDEEYDGVVEHPITAPILILAGWNDDLFCANEGLMAFSSTAAPKRIIITNHGHLGCYPGPYPSGTIGGPESAWVMEQVDRWFDRFLKGMKNGVEDEGPVSFYRDRAPGDYGRAASYPVPGTRRVSLYMGGNGKNRIGKLGTRRPCVFSGSHLLMNIGFTGSLSLFYFQDAPQLTGGEAMDVPSRLKLFEMPLTEACFASEPLKKDMTVMGAPLFEAFYRSTAEFTQLIPWLYEVKPDGKEVLISRGWFEGHNEKPGTLAGTGGPVEMQACYHHFPAGSRIKLEVSTADPVSCWPYRGLNVIHLQHRLGAASRVILPVVPNTY